MNRNRKLQVKQYNKIWQCVWLLPLVILLNISLVQPIPSTASSFLQDDNHIILPSNGQVTVNFIGTGGPGEPTMCEGDFGLYSPQQMLIYPEYLYNAGLSFPIPGYFFQGTELVFYITPRSYCTGGPYLSTDLNRAHITHPDSYTWIIGWEDWTDADFNDLIVQVKFTPTVLPFLDLPYNYTGSTFVNESRDTEQGGKVNAYFDHQYPTYCSPPNIGGCSSLDTKAVNFHGYDGTQTNPLPPYRVVYNGHDGIDYFILKGTPVLAAASGTVSFADEISLTCGDGLTKAANVIKVQHDNGYITEYWHLSSFAPGVGVGTPVARDPLHPLGYVGSTGCSDGPHLHFLVRNSSGIVVDPYGWMPLPDAKWYGQADPWKQYKADNGGVDATSHYLWIHQLVTTALLSRSQPTIITSTSGSAVATFPVGAYNAALRVQMVEGLQSASISGSRSLYTFSLFGYTTMDLPVTTLSNEITLVVHVPTDGLRVPSMNSSITPTLQLWEAQSSTWQELTTTWDSSTGIARAITSKIGTFALTIPEYRIYLPFVGWNLP